MLIELYGGNVMKESKILGRYRPLCHTEYGLLVYKAQKLYLMDRETYKVENVCDFPIEDKRKPFCYFRLGARAAHISAYCGIEDKGGALVAFNRGVYYVDLINKVVVREHDFFPKTMRRPLSFSKIEAIHGFDDCIVYGEYMANVDHSSVAIYARVSNQWQKVFEFPPNTIEHIHSIIPDPYRNRVLILTGDKDEESAIWAAEDNFKSVKPILKGNQTYRACCAKAYKEGVMIITDSPFDDNYVYMVYENGLEVKVEKIASLPGPTVFYTFIGEKVIFATDVEFDFKNIQGKRLYFTRKLGAGVKDWYVHVFAGNPQSGFVEIAQYEKDILPMGIFGFGNVHFPTGEYTNKLFMSPLAVKKYDEKLVVVDL
jgi:hypothetical protein